MNAFSLIDCAYNAPPSPAPVTYVFDVWSLAFQLGVPFGAYPLETYMYAPGYGPLFGL